MKDCSHEHAGTDQPRGGTRVKRALGVQAALEWAFRVEKAQLELPPPRDVPEESSGFGLEYVLMQRAALGCKVDGGQYKMGGYTHPDAEVIAATVAGMPDSLGGKRMAIRVVELARAGTHPRLDARGRAALRASGDETQSAWRPRRDGSRGHRASEGSRQMADRRGPCLSGEISPGRHSRSKLRDAAYDDWWQALGWVRDGLVGCRMLREVEVTAAMPKVKPWEGPRASR